MEGITLNPMPVGLPGMDGQVASLARQAGIADDSKMEGAATEFEGLFLSMMLKEMRNSLSEDSLFGGESSDVYGGLFDMMLSQSMAETQPLGIAKLLQSQMGYKSDNSASENASGNTNENATRDISVDIDA